LWYVKDLESCTTNELSFCATNVTERDKISETVITLELDNFSSRIINDKSNSHWLEKQPFTQNSCFDKLKLVVCYGLPDWLGSNKESKTIDFNTVDKTVFLYWNVSDIAIINSIKSNINHHKNLSLYIILNEKDEFFKDDAGGNLKHPKLRSFTLSFE
jgi:hypothetical protein